MKIKVYQCKIDNYVEMISLGKVKYIGESFGVDSLTNGKIYDFVEFLPEKGLIRIVDDSEEDYLYPIDNPRPLDGSSKGGKWELIEMYDEKLKDWIKNKK